MEFLKIKKEKKYQILKNIHHGQEKSFQENQNINQIIMKHLKYLEILKRKIQKYLIKIKKIYLNNLILIKIREMNFFMNKQKLMKNYFYQQQL